jgi:hypothetical protein
MRRTLIRRRRMSGEFIAHGYKYTPSPPPIRPEISRRTSLRAQMRPKALRARRPSDCTMTSVRSDYAGEKLASDKLAASHLCSCGNLDTSFSIC